MANIFFQHSIQTGPLCYVDTYLFFSGCFLGPSSSSACFSHFAPRTSSRSGRPHPGFTMPVSSSAFTQFVADGGRACLSSSPLSHIDNSIWIMVVGQHPNQTFAMTWKVFLVNWRVPQSGAFSKGPCVIDTSSLDNPDWKYSMYR